MCHPFRQERKRSRNIPNISSIQTEIRKTILIFFYYYYQPSENTTPHHVQVPTWFWSTASPLFTEYLKNNASYLHTCLPSTSTGSYQNNTEPQHYIIPPLQTSYTLRLKILIPIQISLPQEQPEPWVIFDLLLSGKVGKLLCNSSFRKNDVKLMQIMQSTQREKTTPTP